MVEEEEEEKEKEKRVTQKMQGSDKDSLSGRSLQKEEFRRRHCVDRSLHHYYTTMKIEEEKKKRREGKNIVIKILACSIMVVQYQLILDGILGREKR